ncbi:MAG TPA: hypothetical protein VFN99_06140 [Gaiella sp.]|jgi:hypothetical protein|nr:hypothetical protein [Gaiella sp.]
MKRKRKKKLEIRTPEEIERSERTNKKLLERIAYYEARIAARERGEDPDAVTG